LRIGASSSTTRIDCWIIASVLPFVLDIDVPRFHLRGNEHTETSTAAEPISDKHAAAVRQNNGLADRQAKPAAGYFRMLGGLCAEERGEDAISILRRDARALIVYRQLQLAVVGDPR
jgi:hypothetical protein